MGRSGYLMHRLLSLIAISVALLMIGCRIEHRVQHDGYAESFSDLTVEQVDYGFSGETVHFVVFQTAHQSLTPCAHLTMTTLSGGSTLCWGYIRLPDGTQQDLPTSGYIYESTPTQFKSAKISFTTSQLRSYLDSHPQPATIAGLTQFVAQKRQ